MKSTILASNFAPTAMQTFTYRGSIPYFDKDVPAYIVNLHGQQNTNALDRNVFQITKFEAVIAQSECDALALKEGHRMRITISLERE